MYEGIRPLFVLYMRTVTMICRRCGNPTETIQRIGGVKDKLIDGTKMCVECRTRGIEKSRKRMLENNPAKSESVRKKISDTLKRKYDSGEITSIFQDPEKRKAARVDVVLSEEGRKILRDKMIENNPMFSLKTRKKVSDTILRKIKSGDLIYKKGYKHHLYKGTRNFSNDCRKWLKSWIRLVMERDKFSCVKCGVVGGILHTHHIRPLRNIITLVLEENKIKNIESVKTGDIEIYEKMIQKVVDNHKLEDGETVCKQCHANIDNRYRRIPKA